jgi:membrane glycosyltransferase
MRHGMRPFTRGSAWWAADCGPFWGHNAAIRIAPFTDYCKMPHLPGKPPFGGHILSHDYVEAALMRRAGFEVRVLPDEDGSYEENPPTMIDYGQRDLRWCNGNLQYFRLVGLPALLPTSRMQFALLIQMFMLAPTIMLFTILAALKAPLWPAGVEFPAASAALLYGILLFMYLSPQIFGVLEAVLNFPRSYGGVLRLLAGLVVNVLFIFFLIPISIFDQAVFMIFLLFGKGGGWATQQRDGYRVPWTVAARRMWQPTAFAAALLLFLVFTAPGAIPWFLPFLGGLLLSIPFTVLTSMPEVGEAAVRWRLCSVPEEFQTPAEISKLLAPG